MFALLTSQLPIPSISGEELKVVGENVVGNSGNLLENVDDRVAGFLVFYYLSSLLRYPKYTLQ